MRLLISTRDARVMALHPEVASTNPYRSLQSGMVSYSDSSIPGNKNS